jgi:hypothetical protein
MRNSFTNKVRREATGLAALASLFLLTGCAPGQSESQTRTVIRIGLPDGAAGIAARYVTERMGGEVIMVSPIHDCCSTTAEWALSGDDIDAAILCSDAAQSLLEKDNRYIIIGPCVANSDVIVIRDKIKTGKIGISQNHFYQTEIVKSSFGSKYELVFLMPSALPYAYEKGLVDGVVIDIEQAALLPGQTLSSRSVSGDAVTYVLAARKDYQNQPGFIKFVQGFSEAADDLTNPDILQWAIGEYGNYPANGKEAEQWISLGVRLIAPR